MSVELVTGYYGVGEDGKPKRHVSSAEDGARQAGTVGLGCYVLSTGSKMSAIMEDANTLLVSDGDALINGRHVRIPDSLSFTIPTGVQGQKVSNLAVLRYQVGADSVESVTPVVLTGEPSTGKPTDPEHNDGSVLEGASIVDMPLYRVVTSGTNYETPVLLPRVVKPLDDLKSYVDMESEDLSSAIAKKLDASRVKTGNKIIRVTTAAAGQWAASDNLLQPSELKTMLGRAYDSGRDAVVVWNADWESANVLVLPFCHTTDKGSNFGVMVMVPQGFSGGGESKDIRIGYMVLKG